MKKRIGLLALFIISLILAGCKFIMPSTTPADDLPIRETLNVITPTEKVFEGDPTKSGKIGESALVSAIDVIFLESFPLQAHLIVYGDLPDGCTSVQDVVVTRTDNTFYGKVMTLRDPDAMCIQVLVPFEVSAPLDIYGLPAGEYTVTVQEISTSFTLSQDNALDMPVLDLPACPQPAENQLLYQTEDFCFLYPMDFAISNEMSMLLANGMVFKQAGNPAGVVQYTLMPLTGRSLEDTVNEQVALMRTPGLEPMVFAYENGLSGYVLDGVPLQAGSGRITWLEHLGVMYRFEFYPYNLDSPAEGASAGISNFYDMMFATWVWLQ